jgi:hypothetical protein
MPGRIMVAHPLPARIETERAQVKTQCDLTALLSVVNNLPMPKQSTAVALIAL